VVLNAAPARTLPAGMAALVDVLVVNAVEAAMMGAGPVTSLQSAGLAARHLAQTCRAVIVTAGAQGLAGCGPDEQFAVPAERVTVKSTHGAGDSFTGTLAAALVQSVPMLDAARKASLAAARHVAGNVRAAGRA
jgi:ribokinase